MDLLSGSLAFYGWVLVLGPAGSACAWFRGGVRGLLAVGGWAVRIFNPLWGERYLGCGVASLSVRPSRGLLFWLASAIVVVTIVLVSLIFLRLFRLPFFFIDVLGAVNSTVHWIGWVGALYIALVTPLYVIVKRRSPRRLRAMLNLHVVGNLLAVALVSIHFAQQVTRPSSNYPVLGTGLLLYSAVILLVSSGFMIRFGLGGKYTRQLRFLHPAIALTFYLAIAMHIIIQSI